MISKEYIDKFEKIITYYNISKTDIYDITKAISYAESFDTHPISINDLTDCGVDYFKDITNAPKTKQLPDTRIMRILCDSLTVILFVTKNTLFSKPEYYHILDLLSKNVCNVLVKTNKYIRPNNKGDLHLSSNNHYKTVEECEKVLDLLEETCISSINYDSLVNVLNKYSDKFNNIFNYKNMYKFSRDIKDVLLPVSIRADLDKRVNTECFNFIQDSVFNSTLAKKGYTTETYCKLLAEVLFASTCQNIISSLESIESSNNPLCCSVCIKIVRTLEGNKLYTPIEDSKPNVIIYTNSKTKVLKEYLETIFVNNGVVINNDYTLGQYDILYEISEIIIKKIIKKGHI